MRWTFLFLLFSLISNVPLLAQKSYHFSLPGYSYAKVDSNGILSMESYGLSNIESEGLRKNSTRQNIASVSKLILGLAIIIAVEKEYLSLDSEINNFLPFKVYNPIFPETPITLRMLANHTSSIRDHNVEYKSVFLKEKIFDLRIDANRETKKYFKKWKTNVPAELHVFLKSAVTEKGKFFTKKRYSKNPPGTLHHYSNLGAALAALVLEKAVGRSYKKFVENEIFIPLKMSSTSWDILDSNSLASYYFENGTRVPKYTSILYPAGGINSSCEDLALLLTELIRSYYGRGKLISKSSAKVLLSAQLTSSQNTLDPSKNYGVFTEIYKTQIGHNGSNYGITVLMSMDHKTGIGKLFMTNTSSYQSSKLILEMVKIYNTI